MATGFVVLALTAALFLATGTLTRLAAFITFLVLTFAVGAPVVAPALLLLLLATRGNGPLSVDGWQEARIARSRPWLLRSPDWNDQSLPHVGVVGAGFGGLEVVKALEHTPCRITLIERRNYHLFQPLLYQVATAALAPSDIATPLREFFRNQNNVRVLLGRVTDVDRQSRELLIGEERIAFDHLVIGTGARHSYFGNEQWEPLAPGIKKIDDATDIRRRILLAFERAESADSEEERRAQLTFAVVGGGPTGVELTGSVAELAFHGMAEDFRKADLWQAHIVLIEAGDRLLAPFPEELSAYTKKALEDIGVEVWLNKRVTRIDERGLEAGDTRLEARTVIWGAGVIASAAAKWLGAEHDRTGRVKVENDLSVPGDHDIFVISAGSGLKVRSPGGSGASSTFFS